MKFKIEIEKRPDRNAHVILGGVAGEGTDYDNSKTFKLYIELCRAFAERHDTQVSAVFDYVRAINRAPSASITS
jgi:hypothetical protein